MTAHRNNLLIGGRWVVAHGTERIALENPATLETVGSVAVGDIVDVDRAVAAARSAFPAWSRTTTTHRASVLTAIAHGMRDRAEELARLVSHEMGAPITLSRQLQVALPIAVFELHAQITTSFVFEQEVDGVLVVQEPAGVAVAITPWNVSLFLIACKIAPALAAGCTVVLKPSELTSLSALVLGEILDDAGVPPGVVNIVTGTGALTGDLLVRHPDVAVVSFTGSGRAGEAISVAAARTVKNVALELGGKSAGIVFADADLDQAVARNVASSFGNSGQVCAALTRLLVERSRYDEAVALAAELARGWVPGAPDDVATRLGPVASATQFDTVTGLIETGISEGARVVVGGPGRPEGYETGYYVRPTILADVDPGSTVAQEEIFGPVLAMIPFDDEDEAVEIANGTRYGLSGAVWTADEDRALRVARAVQTGSISINGRGGSLSAPFGGVKQSGRGREWGSAGLHEYLETKSIHR